MDQSADYSIKKLEKGPLQRFKNQNAVLKRFGDVGLQVYKGITGKRTSQELARDLGMESDKFMEILDFLHQSGMVDLQPLGGKGAKEEDESPGSSEEKSAEESLEPSPEAEPSEEEPKPTRKKRSKAKEESDEITPVEIEPESLETEKEPSQELESPSGEEQPSTEEQTEDEIKPIEIDEDRKEETDQSEEAPPEEPPPEEDKVSEEQISPVDQESEESPTSSMSPVEKIIFDKYGDIGLRVYTLIDGQRTAEEIMHETGLTEAQLVEMLDFMDEQGIIKLDYPKNQSGSGTAKSTAAAPASEKSESGFTPMVEGEEANETAGPVPSPLEIPIKAPTNLVKSVQSKAKVMLKFGDKGSKVLELVDGKNDLIDITLKSKQTLPMVLDMTKYMMENGMLIIKPIPRTEVHKKYGDDGYSVYKKYGKEGLLLYELIGKELTIRQMADKVTTDRAKIIDMFIFIHQVLGIELPIDRTVLSQQLGL